MGRKSSSASRWRSSDGVSSTASTTRPAVAPGVAASAPKSRLQEAPLRLGVEGEGAAGVVGETGGLAGRQVDILHRLHVEAGVVGVRRQDDSFSAAPAEVAATTAANASVKHARRTSRTGRKGRIQETPLVPAAWAGSMDEVPGTVVRPERGCQSRYCVVLHIWLLRRLSFSRLPDYSAHRHAALPQCTALQPQTWAQLRAPVSLVGWHTTCGMHDRRPPETSV